METLPAISTSLKEELKASRQESDRLFRILNPEALYDRPIAERHRVLFYLGHLDGFDSIQICREGLGVKSEDSSLDNLFQAGIDPDSSALPSDQPSDWPSLSEVRAYADRCRQHVDQFLDEASEETVYMALEHRLMHLETLTYMFHNFSYERKVVANQDRIVTSNAVPLNRWCSIPTGKALLGKNEDEHFGWDNEYSKLSVNVPAFRIQQHSITNGEYLDFVKQGACAPHFWTPRDGQYSYRGMFSEFPLPLDWPVYVTQQEALAYAGWRGHSLPTEAQFHRAAYGTPGGETQSFPWGEEHPSAARGNFDFRRWDPESVTATPAGDSAFGVSQMIGNGWQWTATEFAPFPGFQSRASYPGYSSNFFDGDHYVIKGGSSRTAARLLRASFRNWFRADYPYTYTTFRCVER